MDGPLEDFGTHKNPDSLLMKFLEPKPRKRRGGSPKVVELTLAHVRSDLGSRSHKDYQTKTKENPSQFNSSLKKKKIELKGSFGY